MAYENTDVAVPKSQEAIRNLILGNGGSAIAFISQPPAEGFEALMTIDEKKYRIRILAHCREKRTIEGRAQEERRVWRVLFYHMKAMFEAAKSGVFELREIILPFVVASDNKTIAEHILPNLEKSLAGNPALLLPAGREK